MPYITEGQGKGEIQIDLRTIEGLSRKYWPDFEKPISRYNNVLRATVSNEGWLTVITDLAKHKSGDKLAGLLRQLEANIILACEDKAKHPVRV